MQIQHFRNEQKRETRGGNNYPLHLPTAKLSFSPDQLACLNHYFNDQLDNTDNEADVHNRGGDDDLHSLVERLIQRLICAVGTLDSRFASMLLINADPTANTTRKSGNGVRLSYLVRLDQLSSPATYDDDDDDDDGDVADDDEHRHGRGRPVCVVCEGQGQGEGAPQGFAKIRLQGDGCHRWAEFVNTNGYLRRDKVQERFVELLAQAAARGHTLCGEPHAIDESRLCGAPGKVVSDALTAHRILRTPAAQRIYYGPASCNRAHFPDAREFRIAIVEGGGGGGGACVRLRVALLTRHLFHEAAATAAATDKDVRVTLALGIEAQGWPRSADFPLRAPITHPDALLYQRAATTGFYVVPSAPHPSTRCDDRSATWQLRFPAAERLLLLVDAPHSTANRTLATLAAILGDLRRTTVSGGRACSAHLLATLVWFALEQDADTPLQAMRQWHKSQLSRHVLKCVDQLIFALRSQRQRSYFFPWLNIVLNVAASEGDTGGACATHHFTEEDFTHDAQLLHTYLTRLHAVSLSPRLSHTSAAHETEGSCGQAQVGSALMDRWSRLLADMAPAPSTRLSRRRSSNSAESIYSPRQLNYIGQLLRGMLMVKALTLTQTPDMPSWYLDAGATPDYPALHSSSTTPPDYWDQSSSSSGEDVVYLLSAILDQARRRRKADTKETKRTLSAPTTTTTTTYQSAVHCLMQQVRANNCHLPYNDDVILVREVLRWLYVAADFDRRQLAPVVRPFLAQLFTVSHQNCWHTDLWQRNMDAADEEAHALGRFCALVNNEGLRPRDGIVDALQKGWRWAAALVETAGRMEDGVELILTPRDGTTVRHRVTVTSSPLSHTTATTSSLGRRVTHPSTTVTLVKQHSTLHESLAARFRQAADGVCGTVIGVGADQWQTTPHSYLRANSPMSVVMATAKQYTRQHCSYATTIVNALITLNKFTVLQEIASLLAEDQRSQALDDIRRIIRERRRTHAHQRAATLAHASNTSTSFSSHHSSATSDSRSMQVGIDSVAVNSHSRHRTQSCLNMTTMDDNYATYRSLDELSSFAAAAAADNKHHHHQQQPEPEEEGGRRSLAGTLLGTCRLARSCHTQAAVCDAAFFDAPTFYHCDESVFFNPCAQPLLALTNDNRLTLLRRSQQCVQRMRTASQQPSSSKVNSSSNNKNDKMVTKL